MQRDTILHIVRTDILSILLPIGGTVRHITADCQDREINTLLTIVRTDRLTLLRITSTDRHIAVYCQDRNNLSCQMSRSQNYFPVSEKRNSNRGNNKQTFLLLTPCYS